MTNLKKVTGRVLPLVAVGVVAILLASVGAQGQYEEEDLRLFGDPEDLTPLHPKHFQHDVRPPPTEPPPQLPKVWKLYKSKKGEEGDLVSAGSRQKPQRQSYSRHYNPKPKHYSHENRHSDGKQGKGGYQKSNAYEGRNGYSSYSSFDRAHKDKYADADHQNYGDNHGGHSGGGGRGGNHYGNYGGEYGDDGNSYTSAHDEYE